MQLRFLYNNRALEYWPLVSVWMDADTVTWGTMLRDDSEMNVEQVDKIVREILKVSPEPLEKTRDAPSQSWHLFWNLPFVASTLEVPVGHDY